METTTNNSRMEQVEKNFARIYDSKIQGRDAEIPETHSLRNDFGYRFLANYYSVMFGEDTLYIDRRVATLRNQFSEEL